jgi:DNA-directed RNA polymerase subunit A'
LSEEEKNYKTEIMLNTQSYAEEDIYVDTTINKINIENKDLKEKRKAERLRGFITSKYLQSTTKPSNGLINIINSGAKGSWDNVTQIKICLGQQIIDNKRPDILLYDKHTETNNFIKHGFCLRSLSQGLNPKEFFNHAQSAREKIVIQGTETADTGYQQRKLTKMMENIQNKDFVTKTNDTIIQYKINEGNYDPSKIFNNKDPLNVDDILKNL